MTRWMLILAVAPGCGKEAPTTPLPTEPVGTDADVPEVELRRLSVVEYEASVARLLGVDVDADSWLPDDPLDPFDNAYPEQTASAVLVEGLEHLAGEAAERLLLGDAAHRDAVLGCVPTSEADEDCLRTLATGLGRLAWRRPLSSTQADALVALGSEFAAEEASFYRGVDVVLRALLQHPSFVYRVEEGTPVDGAPGVFRLDDYEIAARLSFLLHGAGPDDALLDDAAEGGLADGATRRALAETLLAAPEAEVQVARFHAMWLGYEALVANQLNQALREESDALVTRVIFEDGDPWTALFSATETWVQPELAVHYGWEPVATPSWVPLEDPGRQGLLGLGAFLSVGAKFGDTSPTQRGKHIRERLLCQTIGAPPPDVNVDEPPSDEAAECKIDQYAVHRDNGSCAACHDQMDPIGFGLENFDSAGRYRTHDAGQPQCTIAGEGDLLEHGTFSGPGELGQALVAAEVLDACAVQNVVRYALGREPTQAEVPLMDQLTEDFRAADHQWEAVLLDLVASDGFALRREVP